MSKKYTFKDVLKYFNGNFQGCVIKTPGGLIYSNMNVPAYKSIMMQGENALIKLCYDVEVFYFAKAIPSDSIQIPLTNYFDTDITVLGSIGGNYLTTDLQNRIEYVMKTDESKLTWKYLGQLDDARQIMNRLQIINIEIRDIQISV